MIEEWVARHYVSVGKVVLRGELGPFGNIFGGLMYPALAVPESRYVDDPDPWPDAVAAAQHISALPNDRGGLVAHFRRTLKATRHARMWLTTEVTKAHELAACLLLWALNPEQVKACLAYLMEDFWGRRAGWPDLAVLDVTGGETVVELVEAKSARDHVSAGQKAWFAANRARLHIPACVTRVLEDGPRVECSGSPWPYVPPPLVWAPAQLETHSLVQSLVEADRSRRDQVRAAVAKRQAERESWATADERGSDI